MKITAISVIGSTTFAVATAFAVATVFALYRQRPAPRVRRAISRSRNLCRLRQFDAAHEAATTALKLASTAIPRSATHMDALMQLTMVHSDLGRYRKALSYVDELIALIASIHGEASLEMLPAIQAKADVLEADDQPLSKAVEQLARIRELQRAVSGKQSDEAASFLLARLLLRAAHQEGVSIAARERAALVDRCVVVGLETIAVASAAGDPQRAVDFAAGLLELLGGDGTPAGVAARQQLSAAYLVHAHEHWSGDDDIVMGHGLEDVPFPVSNEIGENTLAPGTRPWMALPEKAKDAVMAHATLVWGGSSLAEVSEVEGSSLEAIGEVMTAIVREALAAPEPPDLSAECLTWAAKVPATLRVDTFLKAVLLARNLRPAALDRVRARPSSLHGNGLFAHGRIAHGELVTMYPCHAILIRDERKRGEGEGDSGKPRSGGKEGGGGGDIFLWTVPERGATSLQPVRAEARERLKRYLAQVDHSPLCIAADPEADHTPAACAHLINDAASLCATPTYAEEDEYVAASIAGCNCVFLPVCGCALAVVAIRDIEDGQELFASYDVGSWLNDHAAKARAEAWGRWLGASTQTDTCTNTT